MYVYIYITYYCLLFFLYKLPVKNTLPWWNKKRHRYINPPTLEPCDARASASCSPSLKVNNSQSHPCFNLGVSINGGTPKNGWFL